MVVRVNPFGRIRYGEEHCKVALLLSALLIVPLRDVIAMSLSSYLSVFAARGIGYVLLGACVAPLFVVPFLCRLQCKKDMFLLGGFILFELLFFGFRRPDAINGIYISLIAKSMIMAFPYYVVARSLKDYGMLERALYRGSLVINLLVFAVMGYRVEVDGGYSMGAAYAVLPSAIIAYRMLLRQFSLLAVLNVGVSIVVLFFCGTRAPIVCYVVFCLYEMTVNRRMAKKGIIKKVLVVWIVGFLTIVGGCFSPASPVAGQGAIQSNRLLYLFQKNQLFYESQRDEIRAAAWETLYEYPIVGVGLLEDRIQIFERGRFAVSGADFQGYYTHFVFLDWLLEYGIALGTFVSLVALFFTYRVFSMSCGVDRACLEILFFAGCLPLLFSRIWHEERLFFIFLGMTVSMLENCFGNSH